MPTDQYPLTAEAITAVVFIAISFTLARVPHVRETWAALTGDAKRAILLGLYITAALAVMAIQCGQDSVCLQANLWRSLTVGLTAWGGSQGAFVWFSKAEKAG